MSNPIQAMRFVYDIVKASKDMGKDFSDENIVKLLELTVSDEELRGQFKRFEKGYAAEDLFQRIYSLLPWVKLITPLGQEQFPEKSKEDMQTPDYEVCFEAGSKTCFSNVLVEAKLIDADKETFDFPKYKYDVLRQYAEQKKYPLVFALFWRKNFIWTINSIEIFREKSSSYKISFEDACANDLSAIFGDYTYLFREKIYRKSRCQHGEDVASEHASIHEKYGRTVYEGVSLKDNDFNELDCLEAPLLDTIFDFKEVSNSVDANRVTELIEETSSQYAYKLSSVLLGYLLKLFLYEKDTMYVKQHIVVENAFHIVDVIRQKCGGEKFYLLPYCINNAHTNLIKLQFGNVPHIFNAYTQTQRDKDIKILCSHN
ncbi:hypothetical protein LQZ18_19305 [Lachnospiraceae bacterium ZAX-1]